MPAKGETPPVDYSMDNLKDVFDLEFQASDATTLEEEVDQKLLA